MELPSDLRQRLTNVDPAAKEIRVLHPEADRLSPAKPSICEHVDGAAVLLRYDVDKIVDLAGVRKRGGRRVGRGSDMPTAGFDGRRWARNAALRIIDNSRYARVV